MDLLAAFRTALADQDAGRLADAERGYRAILAQVAHLPSLLNLAIVLKAGDRLDETEAVYRRAAGLLPDDARAHAALGAHLRETRQFIDAEAAYRRTLALAPDHPSAAFDLGCVLLAEGRFAEGWPLYDLRRARQWVLRRGLGFPEWQGEPLAGKRLFVWREQGFGDQIMMARFLPRLGAAQVTYAGPPALQRLFAALPAEFAPVDPLTGVEVGRHDYWTLPLSLPRRLGGGAQTLSSGPYLTATPRPTGGRVGLVWRGEPANRNDPFRSLPPALAAELLALPGVVSLDPADTGAADFQDTADLIAGLDLVISVDTAAAHLVGAMGGPLWVMLARHALDWQWPREGVSPWYPQARLFVQPTPGDWAGVIAAVRRELAAQGFS